MGAFTPQQEGMLKEFYRNVGEQPLKSEDGFYEPIYSHGSAVDEPIDRMQRRIEFDADQSLQFFSGFRGSGKTTELLRLKARLEQKGYLVVMANALDYINPSAPIDITDLLLVLAGAFGDQIKDKVGIELLKESYWSRFRNFVTKTEVKLQEGSLSLPLVDLDIQAELKDNPSFRQQVQKALAPHLAALKRETFRYFDESLHRIRAHSQGQLSQIVFIFDSLEQLRGSLSNEQAVIQSVEALFSNHLDTLRIPGLHLIYTVPPWLKFQLRSLTVPVEILPSVQQWNNDLERSPYPPGNEALHRVLERRAPPGAFEILFGPAPHDASMRLVQHCGGHIRDLLRLVRECVVRARVLPLSEAVVTSAIEHLRSDFLPLATEDALWLDRISRNRHPVHEKPEDGGRLARFLDTHLVLYLKTNGEEWYDLHPLVRPEVERIVRWQAAESSAANKS
jgi:hypothetical protein